MSRSIVKSIRYLINDRPRSGLFISACLMIWLFLLSLAIGKVAIPVIDVLQILSGHYHGKAAWQSIVWQFRLPKAIAAMLAGAGLAVSGLQLQTLFNNPLAGPFTLGISSGASLGVAIVVLSSQLIPGIVIPELGNWTTVFAACIGAASVMGIVLLVAQRVRSAPAMLILGLMFGYGTGAIVNILLQWSSPQQVQQFITWTFGSFGGVTWEQLPLMSFGLLLSLGLAYGITPQLNLLLLGESQASTLGLNIRIIRLGVLFSASMLAGIVTAFCGPIAFIGVSVPHLCRSLFKTVDLRWLISGVILLGAALALLSDLIAQTLTPRSVLPLNSVTALIGAPIVSWVILRRKRL
jgi:iron complex transport system permease protein